MVVGRRCPKCGLIQMPGPRCKSCGGLLGGSGTDQSPPPSQGRRPIAPFPSTQPAPKIQWGSPQGRTAVGQIRRLSFHGAGGSLFGIHIVNVLLTLLTLGIYYFWGKVRVRGYLLSQTEFEGDRFAYHGTGKELLVGWLKAMLVFGLPIIILRVFPDLLDAGFATRVVATVLVFGIIIVFIPVAMVGARRYRLSRTSWRGIQFSFRGRTWDFIKLYVGHMLLTLITLGLYYPSFLTVRQAFMVSRSHFGNEKFNFDGRGRDLLAPFVMAILLSLPTLGLCWFWFVARKRRYFWDHTSVRTARFHSTVTGGRLLLLHAGNLLLLIVTLGLAWSWIRVRNTRFTFTYLSLEGPLDVSGIQQDAQVVAPATGEGLASFLDMDFDLG